MYISSFSSYSVNDIKAAKDFYTNVLGLDTGSPMGMLSLNLSGNTVIIYPKPNHEPATFTVLNFRVDNINKVVERLAARGVVFEQYKNEYITTNEKGIAEQGGRKMAWFKDPAGNILGLMQED